MERGEGEMSEVSNLSCPYCKERSIETAAKAHYARGFLLAYQQGYRQLLGCASCVGKELRREAGRSLLYGWFSPRALILTVAFVPWNMIRSVTVKADRGAVEKALREIGVPDEQSLQKIDDVLYALMAAMVNADGRVDENELAVVAALGPRMIKDFDPARLQERIENTGTQAPVEPLVNSVAPFFTDEGKVSLLRGLTMIAMADGVVDPAEEKALQRVRKSLGISKADFKALREAL